MHFVMVNLEFIKVLGDYSSAYTLNCITREMDSNRVMKYPLRGFMQKYGYHIELLHAIIKHFVKLGLIVDYKIDTNQNKLEIYMCDEDAFQNILTELENKN